jgi:hypothetical protein
MNSQNKSNNMPETTEFLPLHAINEFMRPDFRLAVIREALTKQTELPDSLSTDLNHKIKKYVTVPGFRNSEKAPPLIKVLPTSKAFEKHSDLVGTILSCWVEFHSDLRDQVYELLKLRNWNMLTSTEEIDIDSISVELLKQWPVFPIKVNRAKLPGFFTHWPKGEDFESLYNNFINLYPNSDASIDKVSLMTVWISMRLPYHVDEPDVISKQS